MKNSLIIILALGFLLSIHAQVDLSSGLVAYYPFNGNANDEGPNGIDGLPDGVSLTEDRHGNLNSAYSFDGVNDQIIVAHDPLLNLNNTFTISAFARTTEIGFVIFKGMSGSNSQISIWTEPPGFPRFGYQVGSQPYSFGAQTSIMDGEWRHVVVSRDEENIKMYVEGVLELDIVVPGLGVADNSHDLKIGHGYNNTHYWEGEIDDIRIYDRALTEEEIEALCLEGSEGSIAGSVQSGGGGMPGITVKLLDAADPTIVVVDTFTNSSGDYSFDEIPVSTYQVMIVEPLGYISDQNYVEVDLTVNPSVIVDFTLTAIVTVNDARSKGYWKHQFDVYVKNRGNAQETEEQLISYIDSIHERYSPYFDLFSGVETLGEWQEILSTKGNAGMYAKAKAHLAALAFNIVSLKVGQYEIVTEDNRTAGDVLVYVSELISDLDSSNDELGKDLAEAVNNQQLIEAGLVVPGQPIVFKGDYGDRSDKGGENTPLQISLHQNFPNPFNPTTTIRYELPGAREVSLTVFDLLGREVRRLATGPMQAGYHEVIWDGRTNAGLEASSGIYVYHLKAGEFVETRKMQLSK